MRSFEGIDKQCQPSPGLFGYVKFVQQTPRMISEASICFRRLPNTIGNFQMLSGGAGFLCKHLDNTCIVKCIRKFLCFIYQQILLHAIFAFHLLCVLFSLKMFVLTQFQVLWFHISVRSGKWSLGVLSNISNCSLHLNMYLKASANLEAKNWIGNCGTYHQNTSSK